MATNVREEMLSRLRLQNWICTAGIINCVAMQLRSICQKIYWLKKQETMSAHTVVIRCMWKNWDVFHVENRGQSCRCVCRQWQLSLQTGVWLQNDDIPRGKRIFSTLSFVIKVKWAYTMWLKSYWLWNGRHLLAAADQSQKTWRGDNRNLN